jgi:hypothetical protein
MAITKIQTSGIPDLAVTHDKLHTDMDLSGKTVTLPSAITDTITNKLPLAGGTLTGTLSAPLVSVSTSVAKVAEFNSTHTNHGYMVFKEDSADKFYLGASTAVSGQSGHYTFYTTSGLGLDFNTGGAGSPRMRIDASGNVGIGATIPGEKLEVNGSFKIGNLKIQNAHGGRIGFNRNTANGDIYDSNFAAFQINGAYSGADFMAFEAYTSGGVGTSAMVIKDNGNVGIGTTNPSVNLEVSDSGNSFIHVKNTSSGSGLYLKADTDGDAEIQTAGGTNDIVIRTAGQERARFKGAGGLAIGSGAGASGHQLQVGEFDTAFTSKPQGQQKLLHIDDSYVMRVAREHGTGDIANIGWYSVAKIPPFGSSGKVTVSIGGDFTSDIVVIEWISSHNTSLNNGMGAPQLSSKSTFAHIQWNSDPRISNTRVARDNTTGTYYVQVYVSTGVNNNTEGKSLIEVYQGAYLEQDDTNIEAMFTYYSGSPSHYFECPIVRNGTGYTGIHVRHEQPNVNLTSSTATTAITQSSAWHKFPLNSERWDVGNFHDHTTQRFTAPTTGKYLFGVNLQLENTSSIIWTYIVPITNGVKSVTNGNNMADITPPNGTYYNHNATWMLNLTAMDYVELWTIGSGGSYNFKGTGESSVFIYLL